MNGLVLQMDYVHRRTQMARHGKIDFHFGRGTRYAALVLGLVFIPTCAWGQAWTPPYCTGANRALQYNQQGWVCATISGVQGPAGPQGPPGANVPAAPPPSECITSNWNGTAWTCVPTNYLTTDDPPPTIRRNIPQQKKK